MPSTVRPASSQPSTDLPAKKKFRAVVGFNNQPTSSSKSASLGRNSKSVRKSSDTARGSRRKVKADNSTITDIDFFEREAILVEDDIPLDSRAQAIDPESRSYHKMLKNLDNSPSRTRHMVRMDAQDGPWSISVAEAPHDARSYCLYIKTPTHNLTLTRTVMEIVELDTKLRDSYPAIKLPPLPIDAASLPPITPKRKSTFLNTLSRLTSPSAKTSRQPSVTRSSSNANIGTSPITSPSNEINDPFLGTIDAALPPPSAVSTALASYLTSISNTQALRHARVWKRFVRVRTEDLESVRVERAIKRVRSDLAAHVGMGKMDQKENTAPRPSAEPSISELAQVDEVIGESKLDADIVSPITEASSIAESAAESTSHTPAEPPETAEASTPLATDTSANRQRAQSAEPDKSHRVSRAISSHILDETSSQTETGDDSSVAASVRRMARKKRSMSRDPNKEKKKSRKVTIDDFEMLRVLGKGCAGKVLLVRYKSSADLYALKAITKRHVLAHQELQHTLTEQAVLKKLAAESKDPFVVKLWWSFHDKENLFLVMDFHPGGDLATQLARWGRLGRDRARFYAAEIVEGVEGLHAAGVIYRDLKPENILIGADGHIVLTDFGLSKEFARRSTATTAPSTPSGNRGEFYTSASSGQVPPTTPPWMKMDKGGELTLGWPAPPGGQHDNTTTFCGTAEYLAPEVIQGQAYSYEIDWWSFGTMLYEMLTGITPFWAANHSDMYVRVLQDELQFPDDRAIDQDTKSLIRGLLQKNPALRISEPRIKRHPYFSMIDWSHVYYKRYIPPYIPPIDPSNASDTQNFDDTFLDMQPVLDDPYENEQTDTDQEPEQTDTDRTDGEESNTTPSQSRSSSVHPQPEVDNSVDVFDGYSFKGRHSVVLDDDDDDDDNSGEEDTDEEDAEEDILAASIDLEPETAKPSLEESVLTEEEETAPEPKTPEAHPKELPEEQTPEPPKTPEPVVQTRPKPAKDLPRPISSDSIPEIPDKEIKPTKPVPSKSTRLTRQRREKSGVSALDRYLSDGVDEEADATERDEDEDEDWDFVEADGHHEDRNGATGTSLFARGVVDRYKLAVFRKASTPTLPRSVSGVSRDTDTDVGDSPSPSQRRGRTSRLPFNKRPKQFLKPKSPPSSYSSKNSMTAKSLTHSTSATLSASSMSNGLLTPSPGTTVQMESPSLKSKESATSVGGAQSSSDQSANDENGDNVSAVDVVKGSPVDEKKKKTLKKYKENAEKVLSLFSGSSPRQPAS